MSQHWTPSEDKLLVELRDEKGFDWITTAIQISKLTGVSRSHDSCRKRYASIKASKVEIDQNVVKDLRSEIDEQKAEIDRLKEHLMDAEKRLQTHAVLGLDELLKMDRSGTVHSKSKKFFNRLILPDTHGCFIDKDAFQAVISDVLNMRFEEVVHLGDALDCGGFLAEHHTLGFVAQMDYSFDEDIAATNEMFTTLQGAVGPDAKYHYLEGNHEHRIEKWCITQARGSKADAERHYRLNGAPNVLNLEKRNISYYTQSEYYYDCAIPGTIKLGQCYFQHGTRTSKHAASAMLSDFTDNVVFGHTHRADMCIDRNARSIVGAWNPGCLCHLQPLYAHTSPTRWSHGYMIQVVHRDSGRFLPLPIPVIGGESMFGFVIASPHDVVGKSLDT